MLFVTILTVIIAILILDTDNLNRLNKSSLFSLFFTSNIFFWTESNYFDTSSNLKPLLHTWSLGVEMTFYIIFPALFLLINKKMNNNSKILFLFSIIILSAIFIIFLNTKKPVFDTKLFNGLFYGKYIDDTLFYLFPFRFLGQSFIVIN